MIDTKTARALTLVAQSEEATVMARAYVEAASHASNVGEEEIAKAWDAKSKEMFTKAKNLWEEARRLGYRPEAAD